MSNKQQFHIGKDGKVRPCHAKSVCPLGGKHFDNKSDAENYATRQNEKLYGTLPKVNIEYEVDTKMKKYIFKDGSEIRGVMLGQDDFYGKYILGEDSKKHYVRELPEIERETFVKGVDPKLRKALELVKESHENKAAELESIRDLQERVRSRKQELDQNIKAQEEEFKRVYQEVSGVYSHHGFKKELSKNVEDYIINKFTKVRNSIPPDVWISGDRMTITIPVESVRYPGEGDWDFYREYDGTLNSYGSDMTSEVKQHERRLGFNIDSIKSKMNKLNVAKEGRVACMTEIGDKTGTLNLIVSLDYDENAKYSQDYLNKVVEEVKSVI